MSNYNGRRAPNVSQYLANLNTIPSQHELSQADFDLGDENLDFLTNTEFFDFDASAFGAAPAPSAANVDYSQQSQQQSKQNIPVNAPSYQFSEFQTYPQSLANSPSTAAMPGTPTNGLQQPNPYPATTSSGQPGQHTFPMAAPSTGDKRKASTAALAPVADLEETSRHAAEEDKRRRNTAASARFRVKKKQREAALEKAAKEMTDKVTSLEYRIGQLEMENKWLKGLITEKGAEGTEARFEKFAAEAKRLVEEERSKRKATEGVGTEEEVEA